MHRRSSGPSLTAGCVVRSARPVLRPPPTPFRHATHFPRSSVIGGDAPATSSAGHWAGEGLPSSRRHYRHVPRPIRRGVPRGCFQALHRFHGLHPDSERLGTPLPHPHGRVSNDATGFASRYGPHRRSPSQGLRRWASTPPVSRRNRQPATGPPGSYPDRTHTGKRRRAYEQDQPLTRHHLPFRWAHGMRSMIETCGSAGKGCTFPVIC